jgi:F-type H+-transporting ATPase subunit a
MKVKTIFLTLIISIFFGLNSFAGNPSPDLNSDDNVREKYKKFKDHHLLDNHMFVLTDDIAFPLPVILYTDGEFDIFMSSELYDNHHPIPFEINGRIYEVDSHEHIKEKTGLEIIDFSITKNVVFILVCFVLMIFIFVKMAKSYKNNSIPKGIGRLLEPIVLYIRDDIARPNIGEKHYKRYMSFLLTIFFFIWIVNLFGLTPLGSNVTNNIAVTASLAILTYIITTFTANKNYWGHIFWMPGVPTPMKIILAPIELLGTIIKPFSLMIRLYANMTAGHVVLMSILGLIFIFQNWLGGTLSFGLAFALSLLELLVCALQAYIFTMLSALYFGAAVEDHHEDH